MYRIQQAEARHLFVTPKLKTNIGAAQSYATTISRCFIHASKTTSGFHILTYHYNKTSDTFTVFIPVVNASKVCYNILPSYTIYIHYIYIEQKSKCFNKMSND